MTERFTTAEAARRLREVAARCDSLELVEDAIDLRLIANQLEDDATRQRSASVSSNVRRLQRPLCQSCQLGDHARCTRETTLGTRPCACEVCHGR